MSLIYNCVLNYLAINCLPCEVFASILGAAIIGLLLVCLQEKYLVCLQERYPPKTQCAYKRNTHLSYWLFSFEYVPESLTRYCQAKMSYIVKSVDSSNAIIQLISIYL